MNETLRQRGEPGHAGRWRRGQCDSLRRRPRTLRGVPSGAGSPSAPPPDGRAVAPRPPMEVIFCCFSKWDKSVYEMLMQGVK